MKTYILTMSKDGIYIDAEETITAETEPTFWECYEIAQKNNCELWQVEVIE